MINNDGGTLHSWDHCTNQNPHNLCIQILGNLPLPCWASECHQSREVRAWFSGERSNHTTATQFCPHMGRCCSWHTSGGAVLNPDQLAGLEIRGGDEGHGVFP